MVDVFLFIVYQEHYHTTLGEMHSLKEAQVVIFLEFKCEIGSRQSVNMPCLPAAESTLTGISSGLIFRYFQQFSNMVQVSFCALNFAVTESLLCLHGATPKLL